MNWVEDYNQHMSWLKEGIKLLNILDGECTCKQPSCDDCRAAMVANADGGTLSIIIDQEENIYFDLMNAIGEYHADACDVIRSKITPEQELTLNLDRIVQAWSYWSPTR